MCPPAYYAHRAAFRGRAMMQYSDSSASETSGTSGISGRDVKVRLLGLWQSRALLMLAQELQAVTVVSLLSHGRLRCGMPKHIC